MLEEIIIAIRAYLQAHKIIVKYKLWKWILIPGIVYAILFFFDMYFFGKSSAHVIDYFFSKTGLKTWLQKEQNGWLRFTFIFGQLILQIILIIFYYSWFKYVFLIVGSPVFAWLSKKTQAIILEDEHPVFNNFLQDVLRGIKIALRNSLWQTVYMFSILIICLIPIIGWASPVLAVFVECYYFGFSMLDYTSERRGLSSAESIDFIERYKGLAIGNGMVFYLMHIFPVIGWILAPGYAIIAATISFQQKEILKTTD